MKIAGARCLVAGGGRGLGAALALDLATQAADVAITYYRSRAAALHTSTEIAALGRRSAAIRANLSRRESATAAVDEAIRQLGGLDVLVFSASGPFAPQRPETITEREWSDSVDTIAKGFFFTAQALFRALAASADSPTAPVRDPGTSSGPDSGSSAATASGASTPRAVIVAITDAGGIEPWAAFAAHGAAKAAQIYLVKALAKAWGRDGVRVCGVAPGPLDSPDDRRPEATRRAANRTLIGRLERFDEVCHAVRFCVENDYLTGANIIVDGGYLVR
jgi:NAD(P)-dependent dehydrogenase (short-subunit alcohol dehydrogenase family)